MRLRDEPLLNIRPNEADYPPTTKWVLEVIGLEDTEDGIVESFYPDLNLVFEEKFYCLVYNITAIRNEVAAEVMKVTDFAFTYAEAVSLSYEYVGGDICNFIPVVDGKVAI